MNYPPAPRQRLCPDPGAMALFDKDASRHALFAERVADPETWTLPLSHSVFSLHLQINMHPPHA